MAEELKGATYESTPVLSKVKIGDNYYYLKDADARAVIDEIYNDYLKTADKTALQSAINALDGRITTIEGDYLTESDKTELAAAISNEEKDRKDADDALDSRIEALEAGVIKIKLGEKVLAQDGTSKELSTTLSISYDSENRKVQLKGIDSELVSEFDASAFIKDGMLYGETSFVANATSKEITLKGQTHTFDNLTVGHQYLVFLFTDGAVTPTYSWDIVDLQDLVDVYTGGNGINIANNVVSIKKDSSSEEFLTVGEGGLKLSGVQTAIDSGVTDAKSYTDGKITQEVTDRNAAILVETNRATGAEAGLAEDISEVADDLADEVTRATGIEEGLDDRLTTAEGNISSLQTKVTAIEGKPAYNITTAQINEWDANKGLIEAEVTRAEAGEAAAEAAAKAYTDQEVGKEETRATGAETALGNRIKAIEDAPYATEGYVTSAVATEAGLREAADADLQSQITTISTNIDSKIDAKIAELDGGADVATVANGQVSFKKVSEVDGVVGNGDTISGAVVYTVTQADSNVATAKGEAISEAEGYTDTEVGKVYTKISGLGTAEDGAHTHTVAVTGSIVPEITPTGKHLGVSTTDSDQFVKSVGSTQRYMELASYVNNVERVSQSFDNLTAEVGTGTDAECLIFSTTAKNFYSVGNIGNANAATGALSETATGAGDAVIYSIDDTSKGTALKTVSLNGNAESGVAYVASVVGAATQININATAAEAGAHTHTVTGKDK